LASQIGPWQIFVCVSHVDKINTLMIINSISILTMTATCITLVAFPFAFFCVQVTRRMKKKERKI
jgi:ABC-type spermidine/putrescine transport system permease subunit I